MRKPRLIAETDEGFKKKVTLKAVRQGRTVREIIIDLLKEWLKKGD